MKTGRALILTLAAAGLLALAAPAHAQRRGGNGSGFRPGNRVVRVVPGRFGGRGHVNFFFGAGFYGWPYWGPGWGYPYYYAPAYYYPPPPPVYDGRLAGDYDDRRSTNDTGK